MPSKQLLHEHATSWQLGYLMCLLHLLRPLLLLGRDVRQRHNGSVDPPDHVRHHVVDVLSDGVAVLQLEALAPGLGRLRDDLGLQGGSRGEGCGCVSMCAPQAQGVESVCMQADGDCMLQCGQRSCGRQCRV